MPIEDAKPIRPLTPDQEIEFFRACDEWQFRLFFVLAFTGMRVGELTHLLIDNDLRLKENLIRITNKPRLYWKVKTRNLRDIPLLPEVAAVLRQCVGGRKSGPVLLRRKFAEPGETTVLGSYSMPELEAETERRIRACQEDHDGPLDRLDLLRIGKSVWRDSGAIKETVVRVEFMKVTKSIGLEHLTCPKDLRHLFATSLQAAGVDPMVRRHVMGHTTLDMTAHYTHTQNGTRDRELRRLSTVRGEVLELARQ